MPTRRIVIVGAGISGLAAAWELARTLLPCNGVEVVVLEGAASVGGKIRTGEVGGHQVDLGAESMLARRAEGVGLVTEAGLAAGLVRPTAAAPSIWSRGRRWPLPAGTLMGVPPAPEAALGVLTAAEVARVRAESRHPPVEEDLSVGDFVAQRVGDAVVDRLVEPLLAGVYAGHAHQLSLRATVPPLWLAATTGESVVAAAAAVGAQAARTGETPVFAGYRGGMGRLVTDLVGHLGRHGVVIRTGCTVRELEATPRGWRLTLGPTTAREHLDADAVVLTTPGAPTSRLLRRVAPRASAELAGIEYASMAIVTLAVARAEVTLEGSGFLVPPTEPVSIKAATFSANKWEWVGALDPALVHLRASLGRAGETAVLQRDDAELVDLAVADLRRVVGALPRPVDSHVQRWGGGLPQYAVGHVERVERIRADVAGLPGLELAGAAYEGVGIPACIGSGRRAARAAATHVGGLPPLLRQ